MHSVVNFQFCSSCCFRDIPFENSAPNRESTVKCSQKIPCVLSVSDTTHSLFFCHFYDVPIAAATSNGGQTVADWCDFCFGQLMSAEVMALVKQTLLLDVEARGWWFCR